jgi:hypothetical protein
MLVAVEVVFTVEVGLAVQVERVVEALVQLLVP